METSLEHVMVDVETLGNGPNGMIVQVGACRFDPFLGEAGMISTPEGCFSATVKPTGNAHVDGDMEFSTVRWWLKQNQEAQQRVFWPALEPTNHIGTVVMAFVAWLEELPFKYVWACPPQFDLRLLRAAFDRNVPQRHVLGEVEPQPIRPWPIKYHADRDYRTIRHAGQYLGVREPERVGVHHDALDDALHQAGHTIKVLHACAGVGSLHWIHQTDENGTTLCSRPQLAAVPEGIVVVDCPFCLRLLK